jgi:hypothetical protein
MFHMKTLVLLLAIAAGLATTAIPADAGYCSTTCSGYGNTRTCNTYCF